jgi:hypothetical protein
VNGAHATGSHALPEQIAGDCGETLTRVRHWSRWSTLESTLEFRMRALPVNSSYLWTLEWISSARLTWRCPRLFCLPLRACSALRDAARR